jgi:hypothetical protein
MMSSSGNNMHTCLRYHSDERPRDAAKGSKYGITFVTMGGGEVRERVFLEVSHGVVAEEDGIESVFGAEGLDDSFAKGGGEDGGSIFEVLFVRRGW